MVWVNRWARSNLEIVAGNSGTNDGARITYQAFPGEAPVISGGKQISGTWAADASINCGAGCTAYFIDPQDLLRIGRLEGEGFAIAVIYHSHVDAGAYFSPTDRQQALIGGEPTYPAATYLVTSVVGGRVEAVAGFRWSLRERDFIPVELGVDGWLWHERVLFAAGRLWERVRIGALFGKKS